MADERLNGWHKLPEEIVHNLDDIFRDYDVKVGDLAIGQLKEDGLPVTSVDIFESHKERAIADPGEVYSNISDLGHLMNLIDRRDHGRFPQDVRTRVLDFWKAREQMLVAPGNER